ncbi:radical SAM protein [Streptomyces sp. WM6378]|nr:radical SAM protein [Streptomyces sp. WM6378]
MVPAQTELQVGDGLTFSTSGHHFNAPDALDVEALAAASVAPLSVILQVTKRCNFDCTMCSEVLQMPDPTLKDLETIATNLTVKNSDGALHQMRVFQSGGEPMMRKDFGDIIDMYHEHGFLQAVPTNATYGLDHARRIADKILYANVGFEGPRATFQRIRGDYDLTMAGIRALKDEGIPISMSTVVTRSLLSALPYMVQIGDVLEAGKIKLIMPLRKGNALKMPEHEFITNAEAEATFQRLVAERTTYNWSPAIRLTTWTPANEGHMIVVEPNGVARAWPVYDAPDLWLPLGNLLEEPVTAIWERYPFKVNHFNKYLGRTISATPHGLAQVK